jgi:hypothetical protein
MPSPTAFLEELMASRNDRQELPCVSCGWFISSSHWFLSTKYTWMTSYRACESEAHEKSGVRVSAHQAHRSQYTRPQAGSACQMFLTQLGIRN